MKSFKQALILGLVGAIAVFTTSYFQLPTWVLFIAWVSYYLFGTNPKSALLVFTQQILGVIIAIIIQYFGIKLSEPFGALGFPLVVFIVMIGVYYISKLKYLNNIPAYFLGMIVWFGSNETYNFNLFIVLGFTLIVGYIFAWVNVEINEKINLKSQANE